MYRLILVATTLRASSAAQAHVGVSDANGLGSDVGLTVGMSTSRVYGARTSQAAGAAMTVVGLAILSGYV